MLKNDKHRIVNKLIGQLNSEPDIELFLEKKMFRISCSTNRNHGRMQIAVYSGL